jgi:hypothetical protein
MTIKRRRRRAAPPKVETAAIPSQPIELAKVIPTAKVDDAAEATGVAPRRRRKNVGAFALKLSAPSREGETRRWVNDDGNRIAQVRELGYEFVSETGIQTSDPGSRVSRLVGTKANGEPLHAYLMETPDELYAQGASEKEAANRLIDEAITAGRDSTGRMDENQYGHGSIKVER